MGNKIASDKENLSMVDKKLPFFEFNLKNLSFFKGYILYLTLKNSKKLRDKIEFQKSYLPYAL